MQDAEGHHCGDHVGSKHWSNKRILNAVCQDCGPVRVKISPLTESNFTISLKILTSKFKQEFLRSKIYNVTFVNLIKAVVLLNFCKICSEIFT